MTAADFDWDPDAEFEYDPDYDLPNTGWFWRSMVTVELPPMPGEAVTQRLAVPDLFGGDAA